MDGEKNEDGRVVVLILVCEEVSVLVFVVVSRSLRNDLAVVGAMEEVVAVKEDVGENQGRF